ncbi:hypothetical protein ACFFSY_00525 [Paenibacillus aurantiacus]|uniref:Uncharacterized protein n=1 Tax=Paenibacillus aurantiacus TaxID=1936118 RepID=A0ABV5KGS3_9BACL
MTSPWGTVLPGVSDSNLAPQAGMTTNQVVAVFMRLLHTLGYAV